MGKFIDITGQKFGRLTALKPSQKRDATGGVFWHCVCDCGQFCEVNGASLRNGHTRSCGCYSIEKTREKGRLRLDDLTNKKFGKLTVLYRDNNHIKPSGQPMTMWHCKCDCGNECSVSAASLKRGGTKSCGCIKKSYGEDLIQTILTQSNIHFTQEQTFDDCILPSGKKARFDFYIENQYLVEFDGKQHFNPNAGWGDEKLEEIQKRDQFKNEYCHKKNIPLYRIPYIEVDNLRTVDDILNKKYLI